MSDAPVRLLIHGASGRMGRALLRLCAGREDCCAAAAVARRVEQRVIDGVPHFSAAELHGVPAFDVAIDFSLPDGLDPLLALCVQRGAALVSGTTGLSDAQQRALTEAAGRVPVLWAANYSLGVAVLDELVERAAGALRDWDCDIVEAHHAHKQDAPSGTALALGESARRSGAEPRYASLRAGDIVGEHTVQFCGIGERIELVHRATSRDVFAIGALAAAVRLRRREAGRYGLRELLFGDPARPG
ncbi:4-hydroxy-tetrahydrodipicolinate reductase [Luteimonas sp. RD2P54]|uniref:4-hydroxy-tetrahydrodipicolinate reductase n=1 Tax=Luteimonas endophytica TaxID=3042023 RepID=A0ABT6J3Q2_9GAMM|nr:4-hydroxy-tetrahydrodipicolinate reductase [Luteimonas endophytica]MDH5821441.1 4-hydroxy-tetrahydrodipicolinate reductase [Luteimonas endophytica]